MALQSAVSSISRNPGESPSSILGRFTEEINTLIGSTPSSEGVYKGGFAGLDNANAIQVQSAFQKYYENAKEIIMGFNENANLEMTFKGDVQIQAQEFLKSMKLLLTAYVAMIKKNVDEFWQAVQNYQDSARNIASQVGNVAEEVNTNAASVRNSAGDINLD